LAAAAPSSSNTYGSRLRKRRQTPLAPHCNWLEIYLGLSQRGVAVFDDRIQHWRAETPAAGVKNPDTETLIQVKAVSRDGAVMEVEVKPARRGHKPRDWHWDHKRWNWWDN
jgi:hypothetical protein